MIEQQNNRPLRRGIAFLLCLCMICTVLPLPVWAEKAQYDSVQNTPAPQLQGEQPVAIRTADGDVAVEEDWNEVYPYGTFAFGSYQADVAEEGAKNADGQTLPDTIRIPVYRLGGTVGKVTALITFSPAITTDANGTDFVFDYAASGKDDLLIEYENPNPIADYQTLGVPRWQLSMQPGTAAVTLQNEEEPVEGDSFTASLPAELQADSYRWQAYTDGLWKDVQGAEDAGASVTMDYSLLWDFDNNQATGTDLRCVYSAGGKYYCSESLLGESYEPISAPEPVPEDMDAAADPGYSTLEADEIFGLYQFPLTFAEGETVKYIRVTALDDDTAELPEMALFTITGCEGGETSGVCNTLTLMVTDNDVGGASTLGFARAAVIANRAENTVKVPIRREGDTSYNVTIRYRTEDGSAKAGVDYAKAEGELSFAGSVNELELPIELIANDETEDKTFDVILSELQGGGLDERCTLTTTRVTVTLTGQGEQPEAAGRNLATVLAAADGTELAEGLTVSDESLLASNREALPGNVEMDEGEPLTADLVIEKAPHTSGNSPNMVNIGGKYVFDRNNTSQFSSYTGYWKDWEILGGSEGGVSDCADTSQNFAASMPMLNFDYDNDPPPSGAYFQESQGTRDGVYGAWKTNANWDGYLDWTKNKYIASKFGNYFDGYMIDVEWKQPGVQKTGIGYSCHRFLLPHVRIVKGKSLLSNPKLIAHRFYAKGDDDATSPSKMTIRAFTDGSGWSEKRGSSWSNAEPTDQGCKANSIDFDENLRFTLSLEHYYTWRANEEYPNNDQQTTKNQGLCNSPESHVDIRRFVARRRYFTKTGSGSGNGIDLVIYTANDSNESGGSYVALNPETNKSLYESLAPTLSLEKDAAGVTGSDHAASEQGCLYLGSKLRVDLPSLAGFVVPDNGLFITNSKGVKVGTIERGKSGEYYITMVWDKINSSDVDEKYSLHVIYNRKQNLILNITPSVPRQPDNPMVLEYSEISKTFDTFISKGPSGTKSAESSGDVIDQSAFPTSEEFTLHSGDFTLYDKDFITSDGNIIAYNAKYVYNGQFTNLQQINFHLDHNDMIFFNGRSFNGDQDITLTSKDLTENDLIFTFYNSFGKTTVSLMEIDIDSVRLYYDGDADGDISGSFDDGILTPSGEDEYLGELEGDYSESLFKPVRNTLNQDHQYYLLVKYKLPQPRAFDVPTGGSKNDRAQILPAFTTAITNPDALANMQKEELSYNWVIASHNDGKYMYGAEATASDYILVPLGGDVSKPVQYFEEELDYDYEYDENGNVINTSVKSNKIKVSKYTWEPNYVGKLLVDYPNPGQITNTDNITGHAVPIGGTDPTSAEGKRNMNAYHASFIGRSGYALGIQEQKKPSSGAGMISSLDEIKPETVALGSVFTTPSADGVANIGGTENTDEAEGKGPGEAIDMEEFAPDLGTDMPSLEFGLGDYFTIVTDGYQVGFTFGFPVFKKEDANYSGSNKNIDDDQNSSHSKYTDNDGVEHEEIVSRDEKKKTTITTVYDKNDPNVRTVTTSVETKGARDTDPTTYNNEVVKQKRLRVRNEDGSYKWEDIPTSRQTNTNAPSTPSNSTAANNQNAFRKGLHQWHEANGQLDTIGEFFSAVKSRNRATLRGFGNGLFNDNDSFTQAKKGNSKMRKVELSFSVQLAIMFEFNPIDNTYYFKSAGVSATLGFEITLQARLPACPAFYVYLKFGAEVEFALSLSVVREATEGDKIKSYVFGSPNDMKAGKNDTLVFELDMSPKKENTVRGFHLDLDGTVYMSVWDNKDMNGNPLTTGALNGDGGQKEVLFEAYDKKVYVCLEARGSSWPEIENIKPVTGASSKTVFDGFNITPSVSLEVGAGVGVELLKLEVYLKTNIAITMTMGGYLEETDNYEGFYISSFEWSIALGFNLTALFFDYSMDLIAFGVEGAQMGTGGYFTWNISATAANGAKEIWSTTTYTTADAEALDYPTAAYGVNIYKDVPDIHFYNPDGNKTNPDDKAKDQGWKFDDDVSANRWGGGLYNGEICLNRDLAIADQDDAYVLITTNEKKIQLFYDGDIKIACNGTNTVPKGSPHTLEFSGSAPYTFKITAKEGAKLDRFCAPKKKEAEPRLRQNLPEQTLVHVNAPTDISGTQQVFRVGDDPDAFNPTGTSDFQLSGYNTSGDAKKLVKGLANGYTYRAAVAGSETYVAYPLMIGGKPQLVLSKLVMTGDLNSNGTGFVHPLNPDAADPYLLLDNDGYTDLDFTIKGTDDELTVCWVSYANPAESYYTVKKRTLNLNNHSIASVQTLSTSTSVFRSMPSINNEDTLWAEASGSGEDANEMLKKWLVATNAGLTEEMLVGNAVSEPKLATSVFYWAMQSKLNELNGANSILRASSGKTAQVSGTITNMETVDLDGKTYILYSTSETAYFDQNEETPVTVGLDGINENTERGTIHRLYLRTQDLFGFSAPRLLQTVIDFNGCTEDNLKESKLKDGVYLRGSLERSKADPYYSNISFVRADIDGSGIQTVALFEMGGNSFILSQSDLIALGSGADSATITPIFSETMGTEVTIGSDGRNLAAVYTAPVADSQSNALFIAWWDNSIKSWGAPTILAMRNLQIYEDRITYDMEATDVEQAYLGKLTTPGGNTGTPDKLTFSGLQMVAQTVDQGGAEPSTQLTVLTEGSMTPYTEATFDMGEGKDPFVTMVPAGDAEVSFYAIAFGEGEQALGESSLLFAGYDFMEGSKLIGEVNFTNTGTVAIRASEDNPAAITLLAGDQEIANWRYTRTIASGEKVRLTFTSLPLSATLETGTTFSLRVMEDQEYFTNGFHAVLEDLLTIEEKPELCFGDFDVKMNSVGQNTANLDFSASVLNNGSGSAQEVFLQFSYDTGETDDFGNRIYKPIDITGSTFETSVQQQIPKGTAVTEDYKQGVYKLKDTYNSTNIDKNYYRTVSGTLKVPTSCFVDGTDVSGLHLRCEIFSNADDPDILYGVYSSDHNEYNSSNNSEEVTIKHLTEFVLPARISTALGTTLTLPISFRSTSRNPDIVIREISDGTDGWEPRMGVCYFDPDRNVIVAAPNSKAQQLLDAGQTPTGILQVTDQATNSFAAITYKVSSMAEGVNIYKDDASFIFHNADASVIDTSSAQTDNADWKFVSGSISAWYDGRNEGAMPMNNDLVEATADGAYLTFNTVASEITVFFMGELSIQSSLFEGEATFRQSPAVISYANETGRQHTITIKAKKDTRIDRYSALYQVNTIPSTDPNEPKMLWNRSFPDTASVLFGDSVRMTCYIVDDTGIRNVIWEGQTLSETTTPKLVKLDEGLWCFDYTFTKNGVYTGRTIDSSGNTGRSIVNVDWFNSVLSTGANAWAPALKPEHLSFVDDSGNAVSTTEPLRTAPYLVSSFTPSSGEQTDAYLFQNGSFSGGALGRVADEERWQASFNGYYMVRVDRKDGSWARAIKPLKNLRLPSSSKPYLQGEGTPGSPYLIGSFDDWIEFYFYVCYGGNTAGLTFLQTDDIDLEYVLDSFRIAEDMEHAFQGVYDGGGHTLHIDEGWTYAECAPFGYAKGATFRNLHIEGSIHTDNKFAAGLCAFVFDSCTVINCRSSVTIDSLLNGDGTHGGFIAVADRGCKTFMTGCTFDGSLLGMSTTRSSAFLGCNKGTASFRDCLCLAENFEWEHESYAFSRDDDATNTEVNCYYLVAPNDEQGLEFYTVAPDEGVELDFGDKTVYDVAGITAHNVGLECNGYFLAGETESIPFEARFSGAGSDSLVLSFTASAGTLSKTDSGYRLTMPKENVIISVTLTPTLSGSGTEEDPYVIATPQDWLNFTGLVESGYDTSGLFFKQTDDIHVETMIGTSANPFRGCYDGAGHTLDVRLSSTGYSCAPFSAIESATIQNLRVTGTVKGYMHCSGLVGGIRGTNVCIRNCIVETEITCTGTHCGGLVGHGGSATVSIEGCGFAGSILGGTHVGVLWGWSDNANVTITNCVEDGREYTGERVNPVGIGGGSKTITGVYRSHSLKNKPNNDWGDVGTFAYRVLPGKDVKLAFGSGTASYNVSTVTVHSFGMSFNGNLYAEKGKVVTFNASYFGDEPQNVESFFTASIGGLAAAGSGYQLVVPEQDVTIDVGRHEWNEPTYQWSSDNRTVVATRSCKHNSSHKESETVETVALVKKAATCVVKGDTTYTATFKNPVFTTQTKTVSDIPANDHPWAAPTYVWSDDLSTVTATTVCRAVATHTLTETVKTNFILAKPSTYREEGEGRYEAVFENAAFNTQFRHVAIPPVSCDGGSTCPSSLFTDRPKADNWAHIPIDWAVVNRVTTGTSKTKFSPASTCTRAQFVTFLWRTMGQPEPALKTNPFVDVKETSYYYAAVLWAVESGVTSGTSATKFSPNNPCSRAQVVTFLWRMEGCQEPKNTKLAFEDIKAGAYYITAVAWAVEKEVTTGTSSTKFSPNNPCTRAQCVAFLYREFS